MLVVFDAGPAPAAAKCKTKFKLRTKFFRTRKPFRRNKCKFRDDQMFIVPSSPHLWQCNVGGSLFTESFELSSTPNDVAKWRLRAMLPTKSPSCLNSIIMGSMARLFPVSYKFIDIIHFSKEGTKSSRSNFSLFLVSWLLHNESPSKNCISNVREDSMFIPAQEASPKPSCKVY